MLVAAAFMPFTAHADSSEACRDYIAKMRSDPRYAADQQSRAPHVLIQIVKADTTKENTPELGHQETNDHVVASEDGTITVRSACGEADTLGKIFVCTYSKTNGEKCSPVAIPKDREKDLAADVARALKSGNAEKVRTSLKSLKEAFETKGAQPTGELPSLSKRQIQDALVKAGFPKEYLGELESRTSRESQERLLKAIAEGDTAEIKAITSPIKDAVSSFSPDTFARLAVKEQKKLIPKEEPDYFSALERLPVTVTGFGSDIETGSITPQDTMRQLASTPVQPLSNGRLDPVHFAARAGEIAEEAGLVGKLPSWGYRCGMRDGSKGSWAACLTMLTAQESGFRANARGPGGECSYGYGQFCNTGSDCGYGICDASDVYNPEKVLRAYTEVAKQGQMMNYFGSLQRSEVNKHADWYNQKVAPYLNGDLAYTPSTEGGWNPSDGYWSGVASRGSESWSSPGYYSAVSGYGGNQGMLTSLISLFSSAFRGSNGGTRNESMAPRTTSTPPAPPQAIANTPSAIVSPIITLSIHPSGSVARGGSLLVAWAAVGVSAARECVLYETTTIRTARAEGNAGTYFTHIIGSYPNNRILFALECVPQDTRVNPKDARKEVTVMIQ